MQCLTLTNKTLTTPVITEIVQALLITLDATTDIVLDADGGNIYLKVVAHLLTKQYQT